MPRTTLFFRLTTSEVVADLLREFGLHHDVEARCETRDGATVLVVQTGSALDAAWDVRATVGMYDHRAVELLDQP